MNLRYILRTLARTPGFTVLAVATLALGIGINTVVFTIYDSVALRPLPAPAPEQIVRLRWRSAGFTSDQFSWSEYERLSRSTHSFAAVIASSTPQTIVCKMPDPMGASAEVVRVRFVSSNYFEGLRIAPEIGRPFSNADSAVVVVSHEFWIRKLHSDRELYGKTLTFPGSTLSIIGVAPEKFAGTGLPPQAPDLWILSSAQTQVTPGVDWIHDDGAREWQILARQQLGVPAAQRAAELVVLSSGWPKQAGKPVELNAVRATYFQNRWRRFRRLCYSLRHPDGCCRSRSSDWLRKSDPSNRGAELGARA